MSNRRIAPIQGPNRTNNAVPSGQMQGWIERLIQKNAPADTAQMKPTPNFRPYCSTRSQLEVGPNCVMNGAWSFVVFPRSDW